MKIFQNVTAFLILGVVSIYCSAAKLNGVSSYQDFGSEIFVGALFLAEPSNSAEAILNSNQAMRMDMRLTKSMSKRAIVNQWMQSIAINNSRESFKAEAENVAALFSVIQGRLQPGDVINIDFQPQSGTSFSINQTLFSENHSKVLFMLFLRAWIGPVPPSSGFRDNILGKTAPDPELVKKLATIKPSPTRINAIAAWAQPAEPEPELGNENQQESESIQPAETTLAVDASSTNSQELPITEAEVVPEQLNEQEELTEPPEPEVSVESLLAQQEYTTNAIGKIYKLLRYPKSAVRRNHQGSVRLQFELNRDGSLKNVETVEESQHASLNKAALKAVAKATPFDPIPEVITDDSLVFTIPIAFRLIEE